MSSFPLKALETLTESLLFLWAELLTMMLCSFLFAETKHSESTIRFFPETQQYK